MDKYTFILNPAAAHGAAGRKRPALEQALAAAGISYELLETSAPGEAVEMAHASARSSHAVIAVGGDGTAHEVVRGIMSSKGNAALGVLPMGTGNDFVKMIGSSSDPRAAIPALMNAPVVQVDYGIIRWWEEGHVQERIFMNAIGAGFDAQVAHEAPRWKRLPGVLAYVAAVFQTLGKWIAPIATIDMFDDAASSRQRFEGPLFLVTVANGTCSGGGFYLTPDAKVNDGILDVCIIDDLPIRRILLLMPQVMRGRHPGAREVHMHHATQVHVASRRPIPLHADGETLTRVADRIEVQIVPGGLKVLAPDLRC